MLTSLFQSFKNIDLTQALGLINEIFPLLTTDMTNAEMLGYVTDLLPPCWQRQRVDQCPHPGR